MLLEEHKQVLRMRFLLNPSDAAALERLEEGDSTAYLDALSAAVEAENAALLHAPEEAEPSALPADPVPPASPVRAEPPTASPNMINFHG
jgi:hypothetical protein